jgi:hypothetical protein
MEIYESPLEVQTCNTPPYFQAILYLPKELLPLVETYKKAKGLRDVREALKTLIIGGLKHHGLLS